MPASFASTDPESENSRRGNPQRFSSAENRSSLLAVDWMGETAAEAIAALNDLPVKETYDRQDIAALLDEDLERGILCTRLFLALSKTASSLSCSGS